MSQTPLTPEQELLVLMRQQAEMTAKREIREAKEFEERQAKEREAKENYQLRKNKQGENDAQVFVAAEAWQRRCDHRKGTAGKKKWRHVDFNVNRHTFPNGVVQIKCLKCRFKSFPGDTKDVCSYTFENYMVGPKRDKYRNPTGLSYAEWYAMTLEENTTNTETRSEMVTQGPVPVTA